MRSTTRCCIAQSKFTMWSCTLSCYRLVICHVTKVTQTDRVINNVSHRVLSLCHGCPRHTYLQGYSGCSDVFFMIQLVFCSLVAQSTIWKIQYSGYSRCTSLSPACRPCSRLRSRCRLRRRPNLFYDLMVCLLYSFNSREMTYHLTHLQAYFLWHCGLLSGVP